MEKNLGHATAYGYAKSKGYSGTEDEFAELMADYASVGQSAAQSAEQAAASATSASGSAATATQAAQTATSKASEAVTAAGTATTKASEASQSASTASSAATSASTSAQTATTAATTATTKASEASESATTASTAKTDAETARDAAAQSASRAEQSAESIDPDEFDRKIYAAFVTDTASGSIAHFEDGADSIPMKDVLVHIEPVQAGSGDPSPENVRPISGWTGCEVQRTGKNLYSGEDINAMWAILMPDMLTAIKEIPVGSQFTISFDVELLSKESTFSSESQYGMAFIGYTPPNENKWLNWNASDAIGTVHHFDITLVAQDGLKFVYCYGCGSNANGDTGRARIFNIQLELGSTPTPYEPYTGQTYPITFPTEAGTVYGGYVDVTNGELVTCPYFASYNGETLTGEWVSDRDKYVAGTTPTIGAQVVNIGAVGETYPLTPTEIKTLLGQNNIWSNTGDVSVEYRADVKLYINKKIAEAISALS